MATWRASRSASDQTATVRTPRLRAVSMTRQAISPRLAIRILWNIRHLLLRAELCAPGTRRMGKTGISSTGLIQGPLQRLMRGSVKTDQRHLQIVAIFKDGFHGDTRGAFGGKAIDPGRDCRKGDADNTMLMRKGKAVAIGTGKQRVFACPAALPDRTDSVDHISCGQVIALGNARLARRATTKAAAFLKQSRARCAVDRPVHTSAAQQRAVG